MTRVRPIIRQFGSKGRVADQILSFVPPGKQIWCELFAGTASVTLAKAPHHEEHLNDLNGDIVCLFRLLRDPEARARLVEAVALTPWSEAEYHACRAEPYTGDAIEDARRYLVRAWQGINGDSAKGTSWASFDGSSKARPKIWDDLPLRIAAVARRLKGVSIHQKPAIELLQRVARYPQAVVFADPPYPLHSIDGQRSTYSVDMNEAEHRAFAGALREAGCSVILTMNPGTIYSEILADWHVHEVRVQGLGNKRKAELILTNFDPMAVGLFHGVACSSSYGLCE